MKDRDAAIWLLGLVDGIALQKSMSFPRKWPRELRDRFAKAWTTARQIADGGAFNPLHIGEMNYVVAELERRYFTPDPERAGVA